MEAFYSPIEATTTPPFAVGPTPWSLASMNIEALREKLDRAVVLPRSVSVRAVT